MNKKELLDKVKSLDGLSTEEKAYLINLVNTKKKYGLVWEDKPEEVEEQLRTHLPVLKEVKERAIINDTETEKHPNHILIEGDNLHALTSLTFTHEGKIDLIYIDPPYNTGKKDEFKYNDKYVDDEDAFRHSKWLSFINKRLKLAHNLLADDGVMIISIDDHEVAQLKLLCDELFNNNPNPKSSNQIGFLIWDLGTGTSAGHFTRTNEFILVYAKNKKSLPNFSGGEGVIDDRAQKKIGIKNPASDFTFPAGTKFEAEERLELTDSWGGAEKSTLIKGKLKCEGGKTTEEVTIKAGWTQKRQMQSFFEGEKTIDSKGQEVLEFYFRSNGKIYCRKLRDKLNPPSVLREVATTKQGSSMLKLLFNGEEPIQYVKPVQLIQYFLKLMPEKKTILDFFAGSGTTLHSTISQNDEDQGNRTCIIATNNENKIAEEVAYIRNKKIIEGYQAWKSDFVSGLTTNNLRYYQCEFVDSISSEINKRKLSTLCTELLCIKEDCYFDQSANYNLPFQKLMLFTNDSGKYFMVVFHSRKMNESFEKVINLVPKLNTKEKIKIYAFSEEKETLSEELFEIRDLVETVPLPQAIYNAYRATFRDLKIDL